MHKFNRVRQVAPMCPHRRTRCRHLSNKLNHPSTAAMRLMSNYFDHLSSLDTPITQSHSQPSALSRVLYCGHSTQCSYLQCSKKQPLCFLVI